MALYQTQKAVLRFKNDVLKFLKGLTTNTLEAPRNAFVDVQGKIVATFDQKLLNKDEILIALERPFTGRLRKHLEKYLFLGNTVMEETPYHAIFDLEGNYDREMPEEYLVPQKKGQLILSPSSLKENIARANTSEEEFTLFRLHSGLPLQGRDYDQEMLLNVGDQEFVSYDKGCYLGQEIIARVHFKSKPPQKLVVKSEEECSSEERSRLTSKTWDPATKKTLGFIFLPN